MTTGQTPARTATRRDIRRSLGYSAQGLLPGSGEVRRFSEMSPTSLVDRTLLGSSNQGLGRWLVLPNKRVTQVKEYDANSGTITFTDPRAGYATSDGGEYEMWTADLSPHRINDFINQAISEAATNGVYRPVIDDSLYLPPQTNRIKAPSSWDVLEAVEIEAYAYLYQGYRDLRSQLGERGEYDQEMYPFQTIRLTGSGSLLLPDDVRPGLYDTVGFEVAGHWAGKEKDPEVWEFVRSAFDPFNLSRDNDGNILIFYDAGSLSYVQSVYLYRESEVQWQEIIDYEVHQSTSEIEFMAPPPFSFGTRVRLHGGEPLNDLTDDDQVSPLPESYIRAKALVSVLRAQQAQYQGNDQEQRPIRQEWELNAMREFRQLSRMQGVRKLK